LGGEDVSRLRRFLLMLLDLRARLNSLRKNPRRSHISYV